MCVFVCVCVCVHVSVPHAEGKDVELDGSEEEVVAQLVDGDLHLRRLFKTFIIIVV